MVQRVIQLLCLSLCLHLQAHAQKIIYLLSPPRSLSVAFLRMIEQRGDFAIFHEPGIPAFGWLYAPSFAEANFRPDAPQGFQQVEDLILNTAEHRPVFVKEMGFAASEYLPSMLDVLNQQETYFVFLVRNPHHSLISYYQKLPEMDPLLSQIIGYKELYHLFLEIKHRSSRPPIVLLTEDLQNNPEATIQRFCERVGIPFDEKSLHWEDLGESFLGQKEWNEMKYPESTQHWHQEAIRSTGFRQPTRSYAVDENNQPTFEEIQNPDHRKVYQKLYQESLPYYRLFLDELAIRSKNSWNHFDVKAP